MSLTSVWNAAGDIVRHILALGCCCWWCCGWVNSLADETVDNACSRPEALLGIPGPTNLQRLTFMIICYLFPGSDSSNRWLTALHQQPYSTFYCQPLSSARAHNISEQWLCHFKIYQHSSLMLLFLDVCHYVSVDG